jgi:ribosomal protein S27E
MIRVMCPACNEEKVNCEIVNVVAAERRYEVRCPVCGKTFVVYGKGTEGRAS